MGMSTHVWGIRDLDHTFDKMLQAKKACELAGVGYPDAVKDYFAQGDNDVTCDEESLRRDMESVDLVGLKIAKRVGWDSSEGFEIDLQKLPEDIVKIRFANSW